MRGAALLSLVCIFGCVSQVEGPTANTGTITGEVGDPRNRARVHTELASVYYERGNMAVALEELRLAQAADRNYAPAHSLFGLVYMELRETKLAEESFQRAVALAPTDPEINHNFGWFLCQSSREKESIGYFMQALRNPLYATPWRSYAAAGACSLRTNNVKEAEDYFERALKLDPDEPTSLLQLGKIRYRQGNIGEARRLLSRHLKLASPNAEALWLAVRIERRLGERVAEQSYANQLRRRFPGSAEYQALQRGQYE